MCSIGVLQILITSFFVQYLTSFFKKELETLQTFLKQGNCSNQGPRTEVCTSVTCIITARSKSLIFLKVVNY